ncbi:uncharacterized protein METZ01_LOCUS320199, partial [marine metagenome]
VVDVHGDDFCEEVHGLYALLPVAHTGGTEATEGQM